MQAKNVQTIELRQDIELVSQDLTAQGVGLLEGALTTDQVQCLSAILACQASAEREQGTAFLEDGNMDRSNPDGPNQRVFGLIGKHEKFRDLAIDSRAISVAKSLFGSSYGLPSEFVSQASLDSVLLSSLTANIVGQGGVEMMQHADQAYMPVSTPYAGVLNVVWLLTDFTADNGATLVAPGSHLAEAPMEFFIHPPATVPVVAPAGTAMFLDGRTWHGTGINQTPNKRSALFAYYCRPFMRQQENFGLSLDPQLVPQLSAELQELLGFRVWFTLGGRDGLANGALVHPSAPRG